MKRIYFDHSATTPVDEEVLQEMLPYFTEKFGNASSIHSYGRAAKVVLEESREVVADLCRAHANEIYFTGSGTEADNLAILGVIRHPGNQGKHIITSKIEHHAVLHPCEQLEKEGYEVTYLPPDEYGMIDPDSVAQAIRKETVLISVMHANNEVGTINPVQEISRIAREREVLFHTDAVQTFGKLSIDLRQLPVDLMTMSGHKIYGPKGVGVLYIRRGVKLKPIMFGGAHEKNRRPGTENIPAIVGLAKAAAICKKNMNADEKKIKSLRDKFFEKIKDNIPRVRLNGHLEQRLPGLLNLSFEGIEGEALLLSLDLKGVAASSGSACTSGSVDPSHVLRAMGVPPNIAQSSIRFSLGRSNTMEDIDYTVEVLKEIVERLRKLSPFE